MPLNAKTTTTPVGLPSAEQELLLTAALGDLNSAPAAWFAWREQQDIDSPGLDAMRLIPLVGYNLNQLGVEVPDAEAIVQITRFHWTVNQFLFRCVGAVARLLHGHNIEFLLTKGLSLALNHYPKVGLRPMNDGDLLVRTEHFDRAVELLINSGWKHALPEIPSAGHHALPFKNANDQEIDLHRFAIGECPFSPHDEDFWTGAVLTTIGGVSALATNPTDTLFMTCVNSVHSPLRWIVDGVLLIRGSEIDWERLVEHARKRKLVLVTRTALQYLAERHAAAVPPRVLDGLWALPVSWLERSEYYSWEKTDSSRTRLLLRYASFRRMGHAQNPVGFLNYLQLLGNLKSWREIPRWMLTRATTKPAASPPKTLPAKAANNSE